MAMTPVNSIKTAETLPVFRPANSFIYLLFNQVLFCNQKYVSPPNVAYAYRSYLETLLNYELAVKDSHLSSGLWYDNAAGKIDR